MLLCYRLRRSALFILASGGFVAPTSGQSTDLRNHTSGPVESDPPAIVVDGHLDESAWSTAEFIELPFEVFPGDNNPAPVHTDCALLFDDQRLFFACRAEDSDPTSVRAFLSARDGIDGQDRVALTIDPFRDFRRGMRFEVSALGVQADASFSALRRNPTGAYDPLDPAWDAIWSSAGRTTGEGYVIEASIPLRALQIPVGGTRNWGFYFSRFRPRSTRLETRSVGIDRATACELCSADTFVGPSGAESGSDLTLAPTLTGAQTRTFPEGGVTGVSSTSDLGLNVRWAPVDNVSTNFTINPDFSQVEADAPQFDVNTRFALSFPEKRPFFLEGNDVFATPLPMLFTRTIADPTAGGKLMAKAGATALGFFVARDRVTNLVLPANQGSSSRSLGESSTTFVGRIRRDLGSTTTLGVLVTGREADPYSNRSVGIDAAFAPHPSVTVDVQHVQTFTTYPTALVDDGSQPNASIRGGASHLQVQYRTRDWFATIRYKDFSPDFRADAGFIPRVDQRSVSAWTNRSIWPSTDTWYESFRIGFGTWYWTNRAGRLDEGGAWTKVSYNGPLQSVVGISPNFKREFFLGEEHDQFRWYLNAAIRPMRGLHFSALSVIGTQIDFENGGLGESKSLTLTSTGRLGRHVDLSAAYSYQRLDNRSRAKIFDADLLELRLVYHFSTRLFFRATVQRNETERNPALYQLEVDQLQSRTGRQLLLSYQVNPQSVAFLGYSDSGFRSTDVVGTSTDLTPSQRSFFVKLSYAWQP